MTTTPDRPVADGWLPGWGERWRQVRTKARPKLTLEDVGRTLGIRHTAVAKIEKEAIATPPKEAYLCTLESAYGWSPDWIKRGELPMSRETWNRDNLRKAFEAQAGGKSIQGLYVVQAGHGMAPHLQTGDILNWAPAEPAHGALILVAPPKTKDLVADGVTSTKAMPGIAIRTEGKAGISWMLYRSEDTQNPGSYRAIDLSGWNILGRVVSVTRALPESLLA